MTDARPAVNPRSVARQAWAGRHDRSADETIRAALGIEEEFPSLTTHGPALVWRYYDCVNAWRDLVQRKGGYESSLPDNRFRQRQPRQKRVQHACEHCGTVRPVQPWQARKRKYCSRECAADSRREPRGPDPDLVARNREIVRRHGEGESVRRLALRYELSPSYVERLLREHDAPKQTASPAQRSA